MKNLVTLYTYSPIRLNNLNDCLLETREKMHRHIQHNGATSCDKLVKCAIVRIDIEYGQDQVDATKKINFFKKAIRRIKTNRGANIPTDEKRVIFNVFCNSQCKLSLKQNWLFYKIQLEYECIFAMRLIVDL